MGFFAAKRNYGSNTPSLLIFEKAGKYYGLGVWLAYGTTLRRRICFIKEVYGIFIAMGSGASILFWKDIWQFPREPRYPLL